MLNKLRDVLEKISWTYVLLIVLGMGGFFYFTYDNTDVIQRRDEIQTTSGAIKNLKNKIDEAEKFEQEFEQRKKHYTSLVKQLQSSQGTLPKQFNLPDLLTDFLRVAKNLQIEVISIAPDAKEELQELYSTLGITVEVKATFLQALIFLDNIGMMKRAVGVPRVTVERDQDRQMVYYGGDNGVFSGLKLAGGTQVNYPGIKSRFRLIVYRYKADTEEAAKGSQANASKNEK